MTGKLKSLQRLHDERDMHLAIIEGDNGVVYSLRLQIGQSWTFTPSAERYPRVVGVEEFEEINVSRTLYIGDKQ